MNNALKKIVNFIAALVFSYYSSGFIGNLYEKLFPGPTSIFLGDFNTIIGFPLAYIFFLTLLFAAFGGSQKYWWMGVLLVPAAAFELYFDLAHIYFPVLLGLAGWLLGFLVLKFSTRSRARLTQPL